MANKALAIFEKPICLSFEPVDPHVLATALGVCDTPVEVNVLLRDSAVTYAVKGQHQSVKILGQDMMLSDSSAEVVMAFMIEHGAKVYAVREDMKRRGIGQEDLIPGTEVISEDDSISLIAAHEAVLVW